MPLFANKRIILLLIASLLLGACAPKDPPAKFTYDKAEGPPPDGGACLEKCEPTPPPPPPSEPVTGCQPSTTTVAVWKDAGGDGVVQAGDYLGTLNPFTTRTSFSTTGFHFHTFLDNQTVEVMIGLSIQAYQVLGGYFACKTYVLNDLKLNLNVQNINLLGALENSYETIRCTPTFGTYVNEVTFHDKNGSSFKLGAEPFLLTYGCGVL